MIQYRKSIILPLLKSGHRDSRLLVGSSELAVCRIADRNCQVKIPAAFFKWSDSLRVSATNVNVGFGAAAVT